MPSAISTGNEPREKVGFGFSLFLVGPVLNGFVSVSIGWGLVGFILVGFILADFVLLAACVRCHGTKQKVLRIA